MRVYRLKSVMAGLVLLGLIVSAALWLVASHSLPRQTGSFGGLFLEVPVILDAGHGGLDGGAVAQSGLGEAGVNLAIAQKTQAVMGFFGLPALLTRPGEDSLDYQPGATVRQNKNADLNARLALSSAHPESPFLSIHLNNFTQARYSGAQVFYGPRHPDSQPLAEGLQARLRQALDPQNGRQAKPAPEHVYLMKNIAAPAVTIECGFLSNQQEAERLSDPAYQCLIALAITAGYIDYLALAP